MQHVIKFLWTSLACMVVAGCASEVIPDPNDPASDELVSGEILLRNINEASQGLEERVATGEISRTKKEQLLQAMVKSMLKDIDLKHVSKKEAWQFGDAYRLAGDWATAKTLYVKAVSSATNNDRLVNDSLRLARVQAHQGEVTAAITTSRSTFKVAPEDKAPILMAVLYEVVPEAVGKGHDEELAKLIEEAISQHEQTIVDAKKEPGRAFLVARPLHVHNAWIRIARLYQSAGNMKEAQRAIQMEEKARLQTGNL